MSQVDPNSALPPVPALHLVAKADNTQLWLSFKNGMVCLNNIAEDCGPITSRAMKAAIADYLTAGATPSRIHDAFAKLYGPLPPVMSADEVDSSIIEALTDAAATADLVRELDALLHGVPTGACLADLVALVKARQGIELLNLPDGLRVNFRAPDGRRATLNVSLLLRDWARAGVLNGNGVPETMRDAIAAYPVAGSAPTMELTAEQARAELQAKPLAEVVAMVRGSGAADSAQVAMGNYESVSARLVRE